MMLLLFYWSTAFASFYLRAFEDDLRQGGNKHHSLCNCHYTSGTRYNFFFFFLYARKMSPNFSGPKSVYGLDCFACHSINGSDRRCEDPMIRIYEGFIKPETCVLPTKIIRPRQAKTTSVVHDVMNMNGTSLADKGPAYVPEEEEEEMDSGTAMIPKESYCVKIIGTSRKFS